MNRAQSCIDCRRLKRRCDKTLPKCSLCTKVGRQCKYPSDGRSSRSSTARHTRAAVNTAVQQQSDGARSLARSNNGLAATPSYEIRTPVVRCIAGRSSLAGNFLDSVATRGSELTTTPSVPWSYLGCHHPQMHLQTALETVDGHRLGAHTWLPIVGLKRILRRLHTGGPIVDADQTAMFYAISLFNTKMEDTSTLLLSDIRCAIDACDQAGHLTMAVLTTQILVAYYETGQGLFPQAYSSVARAARLCHMLGVHDKRNATQFLPKAETWSEVEERRRLWWAVILLDRYIHVGLRFRPLFIPAISTKEILPAMDSLWDEGQMSVNPLLVMSIEARAKVGPFARLCQAGHLLGKVCTHANEHPVTDDVEHHFSEALQLNLTLHALLSLLAEDHAGPADVTALTAEALCYSGLLLLYDVHATVEVEETEVRGSDRGLRVQVQEMAIEGYKAVASSVTRLATTVKNLSLEFPFFVLQSLYSSGTVYAWFYRESGHPQDLEALQDLRDVIGFLARKWRVAGGSLKGLEACLNTDDVLDAYLKLLGNTENSYVGGCGM